MVEYIRKCSKGVGEVVVIMEIAQVGVRSRAIAAGEAGAEKRRKVGDGELRPPSSTLVQITTEEDPRDPCVPAPINLNSGDVTVSCCATNGSTEELKFTDLEEGGVEIGTVARYNLDTRASKPRSGFKAGSDELDKTTPKPSSIINSRRAVPAEKIPPAAELEAFFAAAEKDLHKRFKDKYNYDIVTDAPLKGRFEWVQLKP